MKNEDDFDTNDIDDKDYPFKYIIGRVRDDILEDGEPALEVLIFEIEKEGGMVIASCDNPKVFLSAKKWSTLKNKIDTKFNETMESEDEGEDKGEDKDG